VDEGALTGGGVPAVALRSVRREGVKRERLGLERPRVDDTVVVPLPDISRKEEKNMRGKIVLSLLAVGLFAMVANASTIYSWDFATHPTITSGATPAMTGYVHNGDPGGGVWDGTTTGWT
jgi:hypothetical protein